MSDTVRRRHPGLPPQDRSNFLTSNRKVIVGPLPPKSPDEGNLEDLRKYGVTHIINLSKVSYKSPKGIKVIKLDINNGDVPTLKDANDLVDKMLDIYNESYSNVMYIHCIGGHGRAGTIAALFIGELYGMTGDEAIAYVERAHDRRKDKSRNFIPTPESPKQVKFVCKILGLSEGGEVPDRSDKRWLARQINKMKNT